MTRATDLSVATLVMLFWISIVAFLSSKLPILVPLAFSLNDEVTSIGTLCTAAISIDLGFILAPREAISSISSYPK